MSSDLNDKANALKWSTLNNAAANQFGKDKIIGADKLVNINSLDELFGKDFFKIIYIGNYKDMGHWTVLFHKETKLVEFFCSFGLYYPEIRDFCDRIGVDCQYSDIQLQNEKSVICGKYCIARINNYPNKYQDFVSFLNSVEGSTPDDVINFLIVVKEY